MAEETYMIPPATTCNNIFDCTSFGNGACCMHEEHLGNKTRKSQEQIAETERWDKAGYIIPKGKTYMQWCYDKQGV